MTATKKCFYAYPSQHLPTVYTIQNAAQLINEANYNVEVKLWQEMHISGKLLIEEIRYEIDDCDVFLCDLTHTNMNVLFELGYAIALNKRIWISLNEDLHDREKLYKELGLLTSIGYTKYQNANDLVHSFWDSAPYEDTENAIYKEKIEKQKKLTQIPKLLYLKAPFSTAESGALTRIILKSTLPRIIDDPEETNNRPLEWYIESLLNSFGIIAHFADEKQDSANGKNALICGMAYGFQPELLMLAHAPYKPAIDYRHLMYVHKTIKQCGDKAEEWLLAVRDKHDRLTRKYVERQRHVKATQALQQVNFGEYEAEDEQNELENYFIRTEAYNEALRTPQYKIFLGRKGSGKTANFYHMAQELRSDPTQKNQVCVIKPVRIELEGIYELFNLTLPYAEKGNLIQSLWKFLIYTELAFDTYKVLVEKSTFSLTEYDTEFVKYVEKFSFIQADFSVRMEYAIGEICKIELSGTIFEQRRKVSEILHDSVLSQLRILLGRVLSNKDRVLILIDNLDRAWKVRDDLSKLADFLFGLLRVIEVISSEFRQSDTRKQKVELALVVFLRSDIFSYIRSFEQEQDKLNTTLINWSSPQLLIRVVEERIRNSLTGLETSEEIWNRYFSETVRNMPTKQYILNHVLPRPRDIILFCRLARFHAINHAHERIEEEDVLQAEKDYGQHTWYTLLSETQPEFPEVENLLTQFMGEEEIITRERLEELMEEAGISKRNVNKIIDLLCEANFLGLEVDLFDFDFIYDDRLKHRRTLAKKRAKQIGVERYKINAPFHAFFEIVPYSGS